MKRKVWKTSLLVSLLVLTSCSSSQETISGLVVDQDGPVVGAIVRIKTTENFTTTDSDGVFRLDGLSPDTPVKLTAFASGYYIVGKENIMPGTQDVEIILHDHHDTDNPEYI